MTNTPLHVRDQIQSAKAEAATVADYVAQQMTAITPEAEYQEWAWDQDKEARQLIAQAIKKNRECPHAESEDIPVLVDLPIGLTYCRPCTKESKNQQEKIETELCDFCNKKDQYAMYMMQIGRYVIHGGACPDCNKILSPKTQDAK